LKELVAANDSDYLVQSSPLFPQYIWIGKLAIRSKGNENTVIQNFISKLSFHTFSGRGAFKFGILGFADDAHATAFSMIWYCAMVLPIMEKAPLAIGALQSETLEFAVIIIDFCSRG
jgi:hypothetical protein